METEAVALTFAVNDQQTTRPNYGKDTYQVGESDAFGSSHTYTATEVQTAGITGSDRFTVTYADGTSATLSVDSSWNSIKNVLASSVGAATVTLKNVVNTDVRLGDGGDSTVSISGAKRGDVSTGDGDDTIHIVAQSNDAGWDNTFSLSTGTGNDMVSVVGDTWTSVSLDGGDGNDTVTLTGSFAALTLGGGGGNDTISLADAVFDQALVDTGIGDDVVAIGAGQGNAYTLIGGSGRDVLRVELSSAEYNAAIRTELQAFLALIAAGAGASHALATLGGVVAQGFEDVVLFVDGQQVALNHPPAADSASFSTDEDTPFTGALPGRDDDGGDTLTYALVGEAPTAGVLTLAADGTFTFDPTGAFDGLTAGENREVTFTYRVSDAQGASSEATVSIQIAGVDDAPKAANDTIVADDARQIVIPVAQLIANDWDEDIAGLRVVSVGGAVNGAVAIDTQTGTITFTAAAGAAAGSFTYTVMDAAGQISTATVSVGDLAGGVAASLVQSSEVVVNTTTANDQYFPAVAVLASGAHVEVWSSNLQDGSSWGVYGRIIAADGTRGAEFRVNTYTSEAQGAANNGELGGARITALADGGFVVVWTSLAEDGSGKGVYAQRYDAAGVAAGKEFKVNATTWDDQTNATVTALSDGGFLVVWDSPTRESSRRGIYAQRYDADGQVAGSEFRVNTTTGIDQSMPAVAVLNDGSFVVAWSSKTLGTQIIAQRYNASGVAIGSEFTVNSYSTDVQSFAAVLGLSSGGFLVSWSSSGQDGSLWGCYGQLYTASGQKVGGEFRINAYTKGDQSRSAMAATADGGFVVVWHSSDADGSDYGIYAQRYSASGVAVGSEFRVNDTTVGYQAFPSVSATADGGFVISWYSNNNDGSGFAIVEKVYSAVGEESNVVFNTSAADTLIGGAGADIYTVGSGFGADIIDNGGHAGEGDFVSFGTDNHDLLWFQRSGSDLTISILGASASVTISDWYDGETNRVDSFVTADGYVLQSADVENLVSAMAAFAVPAAGQTTLTTEEHAALDGVIAANWSK